MTTKRFLRIQIILVLILAIALIGNTFAWARRPKVQGGGFMGTGSSQYAAMELVTPEDGYYINGTNCTAKTYVGTKDEETGIITYTETEGSEITSIEDNDFRPGEVHYFKTVIKNNSSAITNVSFFINGNFDQNLGSTGFRLDVYSPVIRIDNIESTGTMDANGKHPFEFLPVIRNFEVMGGSTVNIEWSLSNTVIDYQGETFTVSDFILTTN